MRFVDVAASALRFETGDFTVSTGQLDTPSGAARGIFHSVTASVSSGATRRIGWHGRKSLKRRGGVLEACALRAWPRAHCVLSTGELTVSTDRLDTPSGSASATFQVKPAPASASSGATRRISWHGPQVAETKTRRPWSMCFSCVAASALRFEHGGIHGEHRPARHAQRRREWNIS